MIDHGRRERPPWRRISWRLWAQAGWSNGVLLIGIAALALLAFSSIRVASARHDLAQRADGIRNDIATLEGEHARLEEELNWSRSSRGVERLAREHLGWARPGESSVVAVGLPTPRPTPRPTPTAAASEWHRLWGLLSGR